MATEKATAKTSDYSVEERILALYELQKVDSQIDEINKLKGELPLEVEDLEDEVEGLQTRVDKVLGLVEELTQITKQRKADIEESKALIIKYEEQMHKVRNNREFDSLNKEIEYQKLEIELNEKRLKEHAVEIKIKKSQVDETEAEKKDRDIDLAAKRKELTNIEEETASEMNKLIKQEEQIEVKLDGSLLTAYKRIRKNVHNGLGVVTITRDACGGCFNRIPPQRQFEIRQNRKIIICEYCGRIIVSDLLNQDEGQVGEK